MEPTSKERVLGAGFKISEYGITAAMQAGAQLPMCSMLSAVDSHDGSQLQWFLGVPRPQLLAPEDATSTRTGSFPIHEMPAEGFNLALVKFDLKQARQRQSTFLNVE